MDSTAFTVMSLCTGIGGLDLGLKLAVPSARTVCMVEREAFAVATLVAKMEEGHLDPCPVWTDLARFDGKAWRGVVDCIIGGYPCQPFSVAGKRGGEEDPRHLFPHIARIVGEVRPAMVFFENVAGHLSLGFPEVAGRLQDLGYVVSAGIFSAEEIGATHRRERLFILAYDHARRREGFGLGVAQDGSEQLSPQWNDADGCGGKGAGMEDPIGFGRRGRGHGDARGGGRQVQATGPCGSCGEEGVADASGSRHGGQPKDAKREAFERVALERDSSAVADSQSVGPATLGTEHEGQRGETCVAIGGCSLFPPAPEDRDAWGRVPAHLLPATQRQLRGVVEGASIRVDRLRALGNGVVPLVAAYAFRTLARDAGLS